MDATDKKTNINQNYKIALIFKAFKHFLANNEVKTLRVRMEGDTAEKDIYML